GFRRSGRRADHRRARRAARFVGFASARGRGSGARRERSGASAAGDHSVALRARLLAGRALPRSVAARDRRSGRDDPAGGGAARLTCAASGVKSVAAVLGLRVTIAVAASNSGAEAILDRVLPPDALLLSRAGGPRRAHVCWRWLASGERAPDAPGAVWADDL